MDKTKLLKANFMHYAKTFAKVKPKFLQDIAYDQ